MMEEIMDILKSEGRWFSTNEIKKRSGDNNACIKLNSLYKGGWVLRKEVKRKDCYRNKYIYHWTLK